MECTRIEYLYETDQYCQETVLTCLLEPCLIAWLTRNLADCWNPTACRRHKWERGKKKRELSFNQKFQSLHSRLNRSKWRLRSLERNGKDGQGWKAKTEHRWGFSETWEIASLLDRLIILLGRFWCNLLCYQATQNAPVNIPDMTNWTENSTSITAASACFAARVVCWNAEL